MNYLVDTNIFLRLADHKHPQHPIIRKAIRLLRIQGQDLYITPTLPEQREIAQTHKRSL